MKRSGFLSKGQSMKKSLSSVLLGAMVLMMPLSAQAQETVPVTTENFVRAETDRNFRASMEAENVDIGQFIHHRTPITPDNQTVIRSNQDTLYSAVFVDLSDPVTVTMPDAGDRFMSMHVINQDHYMFVETDPGRYELTEETVDTRFAMVLIRTFAAAGDQADIAIAHEAQDSIVLEGGGKGPFETPNWDQDDVKIIREALSAIAALGTDASKAFGTREDTQPIDHLVNAAAAWGGQPPSAAFYEIRGVTKNDGQTPHSLTVRDVPVDAFWSITIYDKQGHLAANDLGVNSYNNYTATQSDDGSYTIHFGGCDDGRDNCIPITEGWNYLVRLYDPRLEVVEGTWSFPLAEPSKM